MSFSHTVSALRRATLLLLLLLLTVGSSFAQEFPYQLDLKREVSLLSIGAGLSATGHLIEADMPGLTATDVERQLLGNNINFLDRGAIRQRSESFRVLSDDLLKGALFVPAVTLLSKPMRKKPLVLATMFAETMLINEGLTKVIKVSVRRNRPFTFNPSFEMDSKTNNNARQSFISGHTSNTAAASFFTAKVFHDLYPNSKLRPFVWGLAAAVPALTGYSRYRAGKHFPTDIIAGYAVGATLGILIPQTHKGGRLRINPTGLTYTF